MSRGRESCVFITRARPEEGKFFKAVFSVASLLESGGTFRTVSTRVLHFILSQTLLKQYNF